MKRSKRTVAIIISMVMCLALLAACGGNDADTGSTASSGSSSAPASSSPAVSMPPATPAGGSDSAITQQASTEEGAKFAEHIDIIIDNNRVSIVNPMEPGSNSTPTHWTMIMIYDRLLTYDEESATFGPMLATKWETSDFQTFTFDLRDDVTFQNGDKFTAQDVVNTVALAKSATGTMMSSQWSPVETATALSDYKLELKLSGVNVDFYMNICQPQTGILNKRAVDADAEKGPLVGTGPFMLTDFVSNETLTVERYDGYWGDLPITKSMTLMFIPEVASRATMLLNNEVQVSFSTGVEDYDLFRNDDYTIFPLTMNNPQGLSFNMTHPITGDHNFRMAVAHAMDRDEIAVVCSGEWGVGLADNTGGNTIWGFATAFRNSDLHVPEYDVAKAKEYLAASTYKGETIELVCSIVTNIKAAEVLQAQLADIGVNSEVITTDTAGLNATFFSPDHTIIFHGITFTYAAGSSRNVFAPGGAQNRGNYVNDEVTELLAQAGASTDPAVRGELYRKIQELVDADMPFINVFWRLNGIVGRKGIGGLVLPSDTHQTNLRGLYWQIEG